jgi:hypothetical protein
VLIWVAPNAPAASVISLGFTVAGKPVSGLTVHDVPALAAAQG